ncbi:MAG: hypothetical protein H0V17_02830, partial [Deltaproteobacteria bacterium]|nr:hypothetical protein [Deltaproteobacteria bacterium]
MRSKHWLLSLFLAGCSPVVVSSPPPRYPQQRPVYTEPQPEPPTQPQPYVPPVVDDQYTDEDEYEPSIGPVYVDVQSEPEGSSVPSVDVFYEELDPYGSFYDDPTYGWVFAPSQLTYTPYTNGYWRNTDYGFTWVSHDPFGWATDHYGRWVWVNRWVWRPDTTWGPAWVQWRVGANHVGWSPMGYSDDDYVPDDQWRFVATNELTSRDVNRRYISANFHVYLRDTTPIHRFNRHNR